MRRGVSLKTVESLKPAALQATRMATPSGTIGSRAVTTTTRCPIHARRPASPCVRMATKVCHENLSGDEMPGRHSTTYVFAGEHPRDHCARTRIRLLDLLVRKVPLPSGRNRGIFYAAHAVEWKSDGSDQMSCDQPFRSLIRKIPHQHTALSPERAARYRTPQHTMVAPAPSFLFRI